MPIKRVAVYNMAEVVWVGEYLPEYKLHPEITIDDQLRPYEVSIDGQLNPQLARLIQRAGVNIIRGGENKFWILANSQMINALSAMHQVTWVSDLSFYELHNEFGAGVIVGADIANNNGYDGSTQIAAVADTGIGGGTANTAHPDIPASRIVDIQSFTAPNSGGCYNIIGDGAIDPDSGHGTHVAVSVVGDGGPNGIGRAAANQAGLVFQAVEEYTDFIGFCSFFNPDGYYLLGIPDNMGDLFQAAYNEGARTHSNSWGSNAAGDYTADSANTDAFIFNNPDMTITFSAGNAGADNNNDGLVDNDSIGSPATAKNVITVGASENDRPDNFPVIPA